MPVIGQWTSRAYIPHIRIRKGDFSPIRSCPDSWTSEEICFETSYPLSDYDDV